MWNGLTNCSTLVIFFKSLSGNLASGSVCAPTLLLHCYIIRISCFSTNPPIGLDVLAKSRIRQFIQQINAERQVTVVLTTHDLDDVEKLCKRVLLIDDARLLFDGELIALRQLLSRERILRVDYAEVYPDINIPGARIVYQEGTHVQYRFFSEQISTAALIQALLPKIQNCGYICSRAGDRGVD